MRNKERESKRQTETDVEAERWVAIGWQEVRGAKAAGRCEEKSGDRKAGWRTSLYLFFRSAPSARAEYLRSHQCSWPH